MHPAVVTVAQQKGGAGKTTLVIQLATALRALGRKVAVVDIDPQGSLTGWMRLREHRQREAAELRFSMIGGWRLGVELDRLKRDAELIVVDTPPHTETDAKTATTHAPRRRPQAPGLSELADRLSDRLETRVKVDLGQRKGKITVEFASLEDLRRIVDIMDPRNRDDRPI